MDNKKKNMVTNMNESFTLNFLMAQIRRVEMKPLWCLGEFSSLIQEINVLTFFCMAGGENSP